ncbi:hypothetical protein SAPIO_CDS2624 [Scedosporium apiospermum]|uniref:Uncharacterized protein n=1 Tax=Pseudallescheria apiosperma TaxID=563466 RepID=A0A084GCW2_PSEDA|nr:uncharacterized protein SAPIO_CDS2624 [Scedosporium apiospermum]KEZ45174.1 hypothetical protein SAPIO_CDS2624 [Scedosporium apiospermum]
MTEPEGFEDDLFADLYNDDEAPKPPPPTAAAPAPAVSSAPATTIETKVITPVVEEANGEASPGGAFDQDDEDGDVDFDLGEPETISSPPPPPPQPQRHDIPESPPSTSGAMMKAGSTKEDGYIQNSEDAYQKEAEGIDTSGGFDGTMTWRWLLGKAVV